MKPTDTAVHTFKSMPEGYDWMSDIACADNPELFIAVSGEKKRRRELRENAAEKICFACPVRSQCLNFALTSASDEAGYWAGHNSGELHELRLQLAIKDLQSSLEVEGTRVSGVSV